MPRITKRKRKKVACANCDKQHIDEGTSQTCDRCGMSPLPSYSYPTGSGFHPYDCGCSVGKALPAPPRKAPKPTLGF